LPLAAAIEGTATRAARRQPQASITETTVRM
jgi:hypothetical protein